MDKLKSLTGDDLAKANKKAIKFIKNLPRDELIQSALAHGVIRKNERFG